MLGTLRCRSFASAADLGFIRVTPVNPVWGTPDAIEQAESLVTMCDDMFPWHKKGGFVRTRW